MHARRSVVAVGLALAAAGAACGSNEPSLRGGGLSSELPAGGSSSSGGGASSSGAASGSSGGSPVDAGGGSGGSGSGGGSDGGSDGTSGDADDAGRTASNDGGFAGCAAADDSLLPAEPAIPPACATLVATQAVAPGTLPSEAAPDTAAIQAALNACPTGQAVALTAGGGNNAFLSGPLKLPSGVTLWVDAGATLYASRDPSAYGASCGTSGGNCAAFITATGDHQGIVGDGVIAGQGGEPVVGQTMSWWDINGATSGAAAIPVLVRVSGATNFTLYRITLHDSPKFHVFLGARGFVVWGVTIKTPSSATNSQGTALTASKAHNTDGIDPGEAASQGFIVHSSITVGDDQIAIKGGAGVDGLVIAHDRFGAGHGMSIGSETNGGVSNVLVYDLSIDGTVANLGGGSSNGIRIKSDPSVGGVVQNVAYCDVCARNIVNPIILTPHYSSATGTLIPLYEGIVIHDFHALAGTAASPVVTLDGYDDAHPLGVTLDNVVVDGLSDANVKAAFANVALGPGQVNFTPSGGGVTVTGSGGGASTPNACDGKWVTF